MYLPRIVFLFFCSLFCLSAWADELKKIESLELEGKIAKPKNVSALGIVGKYLIIGSDEANRCQILKSTDDGYKLLPKNDVTFTDNDKDEVDIEGIACEGDQVYVVGSHSCVRPMPKKDESYQSYRKRLAEVESPKARDMVARFVLDEDGKAAAVEKRSLRSVIKSNAILSEFTQIPSKENGIDIEGIAIKAGRIYIGFRGPVLRGNYAPILVCDFDHLESGELLFVNLGGLGIRDMTSTEDGFLILAGPVGDGPGSYKLYSWNGHDGLHGTEGPDEEGETEELCKIPCKNGAKAEGIVVTKEKGSFYEFLIAYDGIKKGGVKKYRLSKD